MGTLVKRDGKVVFRRQTSKQSLRGGDGGFGNALYVQHAPSTKDC